MCQNFKMKYLSIVFISMALFFIVNLLYAQTNEKYSSEHKSQLIKSSETPPRIQTDERNTGEEFNSLTDDIYLKPPSSQLNQFSITIIESQSINPGHNQDTVWLSVVNSMGHTGTIVPQTTLDDTIYFSTTDILIVSSGVIDIPVNRRNIISQYIQQGGPVYIQGEYLSSYDANQTFQSIVDSLGGSFSWGATLSGDLVPMNVLGSLSNTPNSVPTLSYFWYGCEGSGDTTIENYLEYGGQYFGFIFTPPNSNHGPVITNSDQDWARVGAENRLLMENIITYLSMTVVSVEEEQIDVAREYALYQNYPNPFYTSTNILYSISNSDFVSLKIYDMLGREIQTLVSKVQEARKYSIVFDSSKLSSGIYFYKLQVGSDIVETRKMLLINK